MVGEQSLIQERNSCQNGLQLLYKWPTAAERVLFRRREQRGECSLAVLLWPVVIVYYRHLRCCEKKTRKSLTWNVLCISATENNWHIEGVVWCGVCQFSNLFSLAIIVAVRKERMDTKPAIVLGWRNSLSMPIIAVLVRCS